MVDTHRANDEGEQNEDCEAQDQLLPKGKQRYSLLSRQRNNYSCWPQVARLLAPVEESPDFRSQHLKAVRLLQETALIKKEPAADDGIIGITGYKKNIGLRARLFHVLHQKPAIDGGHDYI